MVDIAIPGLWDTLILAKDPYVTFRYHEYDKVMKEFDEIIEKVRKLGEDYVDDWEERKTQKQNGIIHYVESTRYLTEYYLQNQKQGVQAVKIQQGKYYALSGIVEESGDITWLSYRVYQDWFRHQCTPGFKAHVQRQSRLGSFVLLDEYQSGRNDQVKMMRFKPSVTGIDQDGTFIGKGVKNEQIELTYEQATQTFNNVIIQQTIFKGKSTRRKYVYIPPGDPSDRSKLIQNLNNSLPQIKYKQQDRALCLWASTASALHAAGLERQASAIFAEGWINENQTSWNMFSIYVRRILPLYQAFSLEDITLAQYINLTRSFKFVIGQLVDSIGNSTHRVCVYSGMIFDSNETHALALSVHNLDRCVYHPEFPATADKLQKVYCLYPKSGQLNLLNRILVTMMRVVNNAEDDLTFNKVLKFFNKTENNSKKNQQNRQAGIEVLEPTDRGYCNNDQRKTTV